MIKFLTQTLPWWFPVAVFAIIGLYHWYQSGKQDLLDALGSFTLFLVFMGLAVGITVGHFFFV